MIYTENAIIKFFTNSFGSTMKLFVIDGKFFIENIDTDNKIYPLLEFYRDYILKPKEIKIIIEFLRDNIISSVVKSEEEILLHYLELIEKIELEDKFRRHMKKKGYEPLDVKENPIIGQKIVLEWVLGIKPRL